jgi:hypothetical protein
MQNTSMPFKKSGDDVVTNRQGDTLKDTGLLLLVGRGHKYLNAVVTQVLPNLRSLSIQLFTLKYSPGYTHLSAAVAAMIIINGILRLLNLLSVTAA